MTRPFLKKFILTFLLGTALESMEDEKDFQNITLHVMGTGLEALVPTAALNIMEKYSRLPICELFDQGEGYSTASISLLGAFSQRQVSMEEMILFFKDGYAPLVSNKHKDPDPVDADKEWERLEAEIAQATPSTSPPPEKNPFQFLKENNPNIRSGKKYKTPTQVDEDTLPFLKEKSYVDVFSRVWGIFHQVLPLAPTNSPQASQEVFVEEKWHPLLTSLFQENTLADLQKPLSIQKPLFIPPSLSKDPLIFKTKTNSLDFEKDISLIAVGKSILQSSFSFPSYPVESFCAPSFTKDQKFTLSLHTVSKELRSNPASLGQKWGKKNKWESLALRNHITYENSKAYKSIAASLPSSYQKNSSVEVLEYLQSLGEEIGYLLNENEIIQFLRENRDRKRDAEKGC